MFIRDVSSKNRPRGFTLVELMLSVALLSLVGYAFASVLNRVAVTNRSTGQDADMRTLMTNLKTLLRDKQTCVINFSPPNFKSSIYASSQPINVAQITKLDGTPVISAGLPYGSSNITINSNSDPAGPGLSLVFRGLAGRNSMGTSAIYLLDLVVNAKRSGSSAQNEGSPYLTSRLTFNAVMNMNNKIEECYASNGEDVKFMQDEICNTISQGSYYNTKTGKCESLCFTGDANSASCPAGTNAIPSTCAPNYPDDPNAINYRQVVNYQIGSRFPQNMTPPQGLAPLSGGQQYQMPPSGYASLSGNTCSCVWAQDVGTPGTCRVCCSVY